MIDALIRFGPLVASVVIGTFVIFAAALVAYNDPWKHTPKWYGAAFYLSLIGFVAAAAWAVFS